MGGEIEGGAAIFAEFEGGGAILRKGWCHSSLRRICNNGLYTWCNELQHEYIQLAVCLQQWARYMV